MRINAIGAGNSSVPAHGYGPARPENVVELAGARPGRGCGLTRPLALLDRHARMSATPWPMTGPEPVTLRRVGGSRYGDDVTATYSVDEQHHAGRHPLSKGASPESIAATLLPDDRTQFLTELDEVLASVRGSLDLTELFTMLEHWRRVAALQADPQIFARVARRAAELTTGEPSPDDEPLAVTRAKAGGI